MYKIKIILLLTGLMVWTALSAQTITIHTDQPRQEIDNFGASDCWTMYKFGKYATEENINKVADLFFSKELDENGNPKGIGLSLWRMNFGGGSDDNPFGAFRNIRARTPCIMKKDGTFDMDIEGSCGGQFKFLKKAKQRGCEYALGFVNSPPYFMTRNGHTTGNNDAEYAEKLNLDADGIEQFTDYLAEVLKRTEETHGVTFDYVDPVNEPEWGAHMGENNHANNIDIKNICVSLDRKLQDKDIATRILIPEAGTIEFLYRDREFDSPAFDKTLYGKKVENFFGNPQSDAYIGDLPTVERIIAAHSYWSVWTDAIIRLREPIPSVLEQYNTKFWQTEYCILDAYDKYVTEGGGVDLSINYGLYIARVMHADLSVGNASAWHWWLGLTDVPYKDGLLYLKRNDSYNIIGQLSNNENGTVPRGKYAEVYGESEVVETKAFWCFGNYSRFIRPGARRLHVTSSLGGVDNVHGLMVSAYRNPNGKLVIVALNYGEMSDRTLTLKVSDGEELSFIPYITSNAPEDNLRALEPVSAGDVCKIPKRSIVTFVEGGAEHISAINEANSEDKVRWYSQDSLLTVCNVPGAAIKIYDLTGRLLLFHTAVNEQEQIELPADFTIVSVEKEGKCLETFKVIR